MLLPIFEVAVLRSETFLKQILFIAPQPFFAQRGTPINIREMVEVLSARGLEVHLLTLPHGEEIQIGNVVIHRCLRLPFVRHVPIGLSWKKALYDFLLFFHALALSFRHRFHVYHGIEDGGFVAGAVALLFGRQYVVDMDSNLADDVKRVPGMLFLLRRVERFFIRRAAAVVTVCGDLSRHVRAIDSGRAIFQIEDFPVAGSDIVDPHISAKMKREVGDRSAILYTGNLERYQGIDLLLGAFASLIRGEKGRFSPLLLLLQIVGGEAEAVEHYRKKLTSLGIEQSVTLYGTRPAEEMGSFMDVASVLVSPRSEGTNTPLKLYGYMASGKPIVATRIKSHTQVLDETSAYLADPNEEAFADALAAALLDTDGRRAERCRRAKSVVEQHYSRDLFRERIMELYRFLGCEPEDHAKEVAHVHRAGSR